jgi:hypothetical protein
MQLASCAEKGHTVRSQTILSSDPDGNVGPQALASYPIRPWSSVI